MATFWANLSGNADNRDVARAFAASPTASLTGHRGQVGASLPTFSVNVEADSQANAETRLDELTRSLPCSVLEVREMPDA